MEFEFVKFQRCDVCQEVTDLVCISCNYWCCTGCLSVCVQCEQPVCEVCYKEDLCCLLRPWGEKTELHLKELYRNKLIQDLSFFVPENDVRNGNEHRIETLKRTIAHHVDSFNASPLACSNRYGDFFPSVTKYVERNRSQFVTFMEELYRGNSFSFAEIFLKSDDREELLNVMDKSIRADQEMQTTLLYSSVYSKDLFDSLKKRGLLDWKLVKRGYFDIGHVNGYKWIEENGIDVLNNEEHFRDFVRYSTPEVMEYLLVEKGMTVEYMSKNIQFRRSDILEMVFRVKGMEGIQSFDPGSIDYFYDTVKFLKSIDYKFDKTLIPIRHKSWTYSLLCFKVWKHDDLNEEDKEKFEEYVSANDIKACKHMFPYLKEIRKKKIMTLLLCIKTIYPFFQKEIIWKIIDLAYSPEYQRGVL